MKDIERLKRDVRGKGIELSDVVKAPRSDTETAERFRDICRTNKCGNYGVSWTCPPAVGPLEQCLEQMGSYDNAVISKMFFGNIDIGNGSQLKEIADKHQRSCREVMWMFRDEGFDTLVLTDGACNYCERCTYPDGEPCRHPEQRIPSVSGYGIDMGKYIPESGLEFQFSNDSVTFYGIVLFK